MNQSLDKGFYLNQPKTFFMAKSNLCTYKKNVLPISTWNFTSCHCDSRIMGLPWSEVTRGLCLKAVCAVKSRIEAFVSKFSVGSNWIKCVYWRWRSTKTIYDFVRFKNNSAVRFSLNSLRSVDDRFLAIQAAVLKEICTSPLPDKLNKLLVIRARELKCEPFEYDCVERSTLSKPKANKQTFVNQDNRVYVLPKLTGFYQGISPAGVWFLLRLFESSLELVFSSSLLQTLSASFLARRSSPLPLPGKMKN